MVEVVTADTIEVIIRAQISSGSRFASHFYIAYFCKKKYFFNKTTQCGVVQWTARFSFTPHRPGVHIPKKVTA
jgi:hypothetical protein